MNPSSEPLYEESQGWSGAALALMLTVLVPAVVWLVLWRTVDAGALSWLVLAALVVLPLALLLNRLRVRVFPELLSMTMLPLPYRRRVPLGEVASVEVVEVRPLRQFGGYGYRKSPRHGTGLLMGGTQGVLLTTGDGKRLTIGTTNPEGLAQAIALAGGPHPTTRPAAL